VVREGLTDPTDDDFTGMTPVKLSIALEEENDTAYEGNVRVAPVDAAHIQLWARDTGGSWHDINIAGWGPSTGFPIDLDAFTHVYIVATEAFDKEVTLKLVDMDSAYGAVDDIIISQDVTIKAVMAEPEHITAETTNPSDEATGIATDTQIKIIFDQDIQLLDENKITINHVDFTASTEENILTIAPVEDLDYNTEYAVNIGKDAVARMDDGEVTLEEAYEFSFTTLLPSLETVEDIAHITVDYGTGAAEAIEELPETVEGTLSEGTAVDLDIAWETDQEYNPEAPGDYTFKGALSHQVGEEGSYTIPEALEKVEVTVTVDEQVSATYKFSYQVPAEIIAGTDVEIPVTFATDEPGDTGYDGVRFKIEAQGPGDVTFTAQDSAGQEHSFTNTGYWGPSGGFDLPADYSSTTDWVLTFSGVGSYDITFSLIEAPEGDVIAGITGSEEIKVVEEGEPIEDVTFEDLKKEIGALIADGTLNRGQGNALLATLSAAERSIDRGNTNTACNNLGAFINQVKAFMRAGTLEENEGEELIDLTQSLTELLSG